MDNPPDLIRAVTASQAQQELFLSELKRVGTQQEQLKKAVSEAIAFADANGGPLEIEHLKSFPANINTASKQPDGNIVQQQQQIQPAGSDPEAERAQMQLLFAELKRIEGQQQMLKSAVAQNKMLVVMPPPGFNAEDPEDEYAEEVVAKPDPDRFVPSGGLTGFAVAKDLMKLDFKEPEEAPEEFRAVVFSMPPARKGMRMPSLTALEIQTQGSFGLLAEPGMRFFLKRLQEDQEDMLALIKQREKVRSTGLAEPDLPALKIPKPAVDWDLPGTPPQRIQPAAVDAFVQAAASTAQESEVPEQESVAPAAISASGQSVKPVVKTSRAPAQSRFAGAAAAAASAAVRTSDAPLQDARQFSSAEDTAAGTGSTIAGKAGTAQPADPPQFERGTQGGPAATPAEAAARKKQEQNAKAAAKKREDEEVQTASRKKKEQELQAAVKKKEQDAEAVARKKKEQDAEAVARKKKDQDAEAVARKKKDQEVADSKRQAAKASTGSQLAHGAVDRAAALNAESDDDEEEGEEDVQLSAEEMGFPTDTGDAFAALKAKMQVIQGKKSSGKEEEKRLKKERKHQEEEQRKAEKQKRKDAKKQQQEVVATE